MHFGSGSPARLFKTRLCGMARELLMPLPAPLESNPSFEAGGAKAPAINLPGAFRFAGLGAISARSGAPAHSRFGRRERHASARGSLRSSEANPATLR